MKVLFITSEAAPYRVDFFSEWGKTVDLTVIFEEDISNENRFNWNLDAIKNFKAIFLNKEYSKSNRKITGLYQYLEKYRNEIIIINDYSTIIETMAILYMTIKKIKFYMEIDGGLIHKDNFLKKRIKRFLLSRPEGYMSPSLMSDKYLVHYGADINKIDRYPFTSIKNNNILKKPLSQEEKMQLRKELKISGSKVVLAVGRFIKLKRYDKLIECWEKFPDNWSLLLAGQGEEKIVYEKIIEERKLKNIHFLGFLKEKELEKYYMVSDAFVHPTSSDVWGLVINEAMAKGLPVVTTDKCIAGVELVKNGENGYIYQMGDVNEFIRCLKATLENENMSISAIATISNYDIETMVERHNVILKKWKEIIC